MTIMVQEARERWLELCEKMKREHDTDKMIALAKEINRLLEERHNRIIGVLKTKPADPPND
jgi:hypothetical protein